MNSNSRLSLVLYGAGSQVFVLESLANRLGYCVAAVLNDWSPSKSFNCDVPVIVGSEAIEKWIDAAKTDQNLRYAISIGNEHGKVRVERHRFLRSKGMTPFTMIHPAAEIELKATIGEACQILAFAFVGARSHIGDAVILNTRSSVDHECCLGDGVHIAPGATLAGRVTVGAHTMIGAGAVVLPGVTIAADCIIGAGAVVTRDVTVPGTYVGVPARLVRQH